MADLLWKLCEKLAEKAAEKVGEAVASKLRSAACDGTQDVRALQKLHDALNTKFQAIEEKLDRHMRQVCGWRKLTFPVIKLNITACKQRLPKLFSRKH